MKAAAILLATALLAAFPWWLDNAYVLHIAAMIVIVIPLALGMNLMLKIGQLTIALPAFMGIGAYGAALLSMRAGWPPALALLAAGAIAMLVALVVTPFFLRVKGVYFVLLTYAFGQVVNLVFQEWVSLFGGNNGLYGIPKLLLFGYRLTDAGDYYLAGLVFAALVYGAMRAMERSDIGAILQSLHENEMLTRSIGSNVMTWRAAAFVFSAVAAAISGGLYAFYIGFLAPEAFGFKLSVDLIVINAIGGVGSALGPVLGTILIVPLPEILRDARQYQLMVYGVCLVFFLLFMRKGLVSLLPKKLTRKTA